MNHRIRKFFICLSLCLVWQSSFATWKDLWWRADQQAMREFQKNNYQQAEAQFKLPRWKGIAAYRAENYQDAFNAFGQDSDAISFYNRGNALALMGDFNGAIIAYEEVLKRDPHFEDAIYNHDFIKKIQQQHNEQKQEQEQQKEKESPQENNTQANENSSQQAQSNPEKNPSDDKESDSNMQLSAQPQQQPHDPQWLKHIDDDPGGLLKQKFLRDHQRYQQEGYPS
jgi:Ca-activated chloride channel homolog